ncbi:CDP-glycerol:poly(glycerophosphate) glycerophosphotransferase [Heyndrickxia sporothermodurans]|nr:CDP-glycerol:poly(glycerophosphate) glycerophosphotransferase [Heyndrickxia sporothermodurans]
MATKKLVKKCKVEHLKYNQDDLSLSISYILKDTSNVCEPISLLCMERQTEREISFPLTIHGVEEEKHIVSTTIQKQQLQYFLSNGEYWDFYLKMFIENESPEEDEEEEDQIFVETENSDESDNDDESENEVEAENEDEYKLYRIKCPIDHVELLFYSDEEVGKMLIPYPTNKGNFSFKVRDYSFITKVEDASITKNGLLSIKGYAYHPIYDKNIEIIKKQLIIQDAEELIVEKFDVLTENRSDLQNTFGHHEHIIQASGFYAEKNIFPLVEQVDEKIKLKAYMEISFMDNGELITVQSLPLKFFSFNKMYTPLKRIFKTSIKKKKVRLTRTKKAKSLLISISDYHFKTELKSKVKRKINKLKKSPLTKKLYKKVFKFVGMLPAKKNQVIFEAFLGKQYSCNPRAIYEYIKENHPEYKLIWSVDKRFTHNFDNKDVIYVRRFSIKWLFAMARAQYWVSNSRLPLWIPKPKHTTYLQTWHGTPLKKLAADMDEVHMPGTTTSKYKRNFIKEASNWDYLISPNAYSTEIFRRAFMFEKDMIESGYPRNDYLNKCNNPSTIRDLKDKFGIPNDKKVVLYAPTWRDNQFYAKGKYKFDLELDLHLLREKLGNDYVVILRMHYLVAENLDLSAFENFAYDFSNHADINELYIIADILITDYSSVFFDYGNLKRPMLFFVYDIESYRDNLRGFYFDFEEQAPGPLLKTTEEIIENIKSLEANGFKLPSSFQPFYNKFCYLEDGDASKRVVERVFK